MEKVDIFTKRGKIQAFLSDQIKEMKKDCYDFREIINHNNQDYVLEDIPYNYPSPYNIYPIVWITEWESWKKQFVNSNKCIYAKKELNHKVACLNHGIFTNSKGERLCKEHKNNIDIQAGWKGILRGA